MANTEIATGDLKDKITKLKNQQEGGDIIVYGGASFDSSLIRENLIDEYYLFVNPVAIGNGKTIFKDLKEIRKLSLIESIPFDSGIVLLHYEVRENENTIILYNFVNLFIIFSINDMI